MSTSSSCLHLVRPTTTGTTRDAARHIDAAWHAHLRLGFTWHGTRTVLAERRHSGPLRVQKPLYPEGHAVCHAVIVHPPGGIAGGDRLDINVALASGAHGVVTTPGAAKWYKAARGGATQKTTLALAAGARLDWLPQENILFDAADARQQLDIVVDEGATLIGWDATVLGRQAAGERWTRGLWRSRITLRHVNGACLWDEQTVLHAADATEHVHATLAGLPVFATLWAVGPACTSDLANALAADLPYAPELRAGVTCLPGNVLVMRVLGRHMEAVRTLMANTWLQLRPRVHGVAGVPLRLWAT